MTDNMDNMDDNMYYDTEPYRRADDRFRRTTHPTRDQLIEDFLKAARDSKLVCIDPVAHPYVVETAKGKFVARFSNLICAANTVVQRWKPPLPSGRKRELHVRVECRGMEPLIWDLVQCRSECRGVA